MKGEKILSALNYRITVSVLNKNMPIKFLPLLLGFIQKINMKEQVLAFPFAKKL
jgi:hypothetical protein